MVQVMRYCPLAIELLKRASREFYFDISRNRGHILYVLLGCFGFISRPLSLHYSYKLCGLDWTTGLKFSLVIERRDPERE